MVGGRAVTSKDNGIHLKRLSPALPSRSNGTFWEFTLQGKEMRPHVSGPTAPRALLLEVAGARGHRGGAGTRAPRAASSGRLARRSCSPQWPSHFLFRRRLFIRSEPALRRGRTGSQSPLSAVWRSSFVPTGQAHSRRPGAAETPTDCPRDGPCAVCSRKFPKERLSLPLQQIPL